VWEPSADVVYRRLGETGVLVHLGTSEIFELNDTGARIWELLRDGHSLVEIVEALASEFDVSSATATAECETMITSLTARQLLQQK
jgi:hypothetical protein